MKKTILTLLVMATSSCALANNATSFEQQKFNNDMQQLLDVKEESAFIMIDENSSYVAVEYVGEWREINNFVSHKEAELLQLQKVNKEFVYTHTGESLKSLEKSVVEHIKHVQPTYFSVDVYRDYHGDSGEFHYLARIYEYV